MNNFPKSLNVRGRLDVAWRELLWHLSTMGAVASPRGLATREILGVQLTINDYSRNILTSPTRDLNYKFMVAEWLWINEGRDDLASIEPFMKKYHELSDDGIKMFGAYGPSWVLQRPYILRALTQDLGTRQAVFTLWRQNPPKSKDIPCTVSIQFLVRDGYLDLVVNMRSSDIWLGIPYDVFVFSQLGNWVAAQFELERGDLILQLGSSHMYESDAEKAKTIVKNIIDSDVGVMRSPKLNNSYPDHSILSPGPDHQITGYLEPWRSYAEVLGRPRAEALSILEALQRSA